MNKTMKTAVALAAMGMGAQAYAQITFYEADGWRGRAIVEVPVSDVRAVVGTPEQRCWVERQQVNEPSRPNAGGVIAGAIIGGILGHQVGGGTGRDVATAGGAIAGAAIGNNVANQNNSYSRDVRRCENVSNPRPEYWDVTYNYRGVQHRVQMSTPPGNTIAVNSKTGEPRM